MEEGQGNDSLGLLVLYPVVLVQIEYLKVKSNLPLSQIILVDMT